LDWKFLRPTQRLALGLHGQSDSKFTTRGQNLHGEGRLAGDLEVYPMIFQLLTRPHRRQAGSA